MRACAPCVAAVCVCMCCDYLQQPLGCDPRSQTVRGCAQSNPATAPPYRISSPPPSHARTCPGSRGRPAAHPPRGRCCLPRGRRGSELKHEGGDHTRADSRNGGGSAGAASRHCTPLHPPTHPPTHPPAAPTRVGEGVAKHNQINTLARVAAGCSSRRRPLQATTARWRVAMWRGRAPHTRYVLAGGRNDGAQGRVPAACELPASCVACVAYGCMWRQGVLNG